MGIRDMAPAAWRMSSHSGSDGNCVEVAVLDVRVGVRDSKALDAGHLAFIPRAWSAFVAEAKAGRYDRGAK
ncbi:DUF397 domain-containing protein [Actinomadura sp. KC216]|uniref:DUF397 domain-containing protein n=1 Tax=Actinomadura sp. KC216 TaxID=2530370 RepID=UPI0010526B36|nr:DUF397 domain-containing protein [Actinomadura sp. KC216]TDB83232.1 DUF397 domain-containing protein [Actinomadura sp. KC216]